MKITMTEFIILNITSYAIWWVIAVFGFNSNILIGFAGYIPLTMFWVIHNFIDYKYIDIVWKSKLNRRSL